MLSINHQNFRYHRLVTQNFYESAHPELLSDFEYSFVISYGEFISKSYDVIDKNAAIIDLSQGIDHAFSLFNATARKHIRRFEKLDELTFHNSVENKQSFYDFYTTCENSRDWYPVPYEELFESLIFYVCYNGEPISGISAYTHNGLIRMGRIFSLRNNSSLENSNLIYGVAAKKIVYEFCKYAIENGCNQLDLGGVDLTAENKSGITDFKLSFTDKIVPVKIGRWSKVDYKTIQQQFLDQKLDLT